MGDELKTHKDLDAWKRSLDLVEMIYKVTRAFPQEELYGLPREVHIAVITSWGEPRGIYGYDAIPWGRRNQLRRAVVSIPSNIVYPMKHVRSALFHGAHLMN